MIMTEPHEAEHLALLLKVCTEIEAKINHMLERSEMKVKSARTFALNLRLSI